MTWAAVTAISPHHPDQMACTIWKGDERGSAYIAWTARRRVNGTPILWMLAPARSQLPGRVSCRRANTWTTLCSDNRLIKATSAGITRCSPDRSTPPGTIRAIFMSGHCGDLPRREHALQLQVV